MPELQPFELDMLGVETFDEGKAVFRQFQPKAIIRRRRLAAIHQRQARLF